MPAPSDIFQFMRGQLFQEPQLPQTSFAGKMVVITGGNSGLGYECAKQLVQLNVSTLILGCRSVSKGEEAKKTIASKNSNTDVRVWEVDMANYASVKAFASRINTELPRLDALLANAGISINKYYAAEGLEQTLVVNVISTFLLSLLCLPSLEKTSRQINAPTHLTITGSNVHAFANPKELTDAPQGEIFSALSDEKKADMSGRYFLSKLLVHLCARELAKSIPKENVIFNCPNPGWCKTPLFRHDDGGAMALKVIGRTPEVGARCLTSAIVAAPETHGEYLSEGMVKRTSVWMRSEEGRRVGAEVWREVLGLCEGVSPGVGEVLY